MEMRELKIQKTSEI